MKHLTQFCIILAFSFIGELLNKILPLPVPGSIYGMVLLFVCLETKIVPESAVRETGAFMLNIMPVLFIPAAVGLISSWGIIRHSLVKFIVTAIISTAVVMAVSGKTTQYLLKNHRRKAESDERTG